MACFTGMNKESWCARARQRSGDLAPDVTGLAHADDDDAPGSAQAQLAGSRKGIVEALGQVVNRARFNLQHACRERFQLIGGELSSHRSIARCVADADSISHPSPGR